MSDANTVARAAAGVRRRLPTRPGPARIRADRDWAASRGRADFRLLLMDLATRADPSACGD